jgi:MobA/MobL family protein
MPTQEIPPRMSIFHLTAKVISRGKGQSAIASAAYRSGERLRDEQAGEQKFYAARAERILFTDIMAPSGAPEWAHDRNSGLTNSLVFKR